MHKNKKHIKLIFRNIHFHFSHTNRCNLRHSLFLQTSIISSITRTSKSHRNAMQLYSRFIWKYKTIMLQLLPLFIMMNSLRKSLTQFSTSHMIIIHSYPHIQITPLTQIRSRIIPSQTKPLQQHRRNIIQPFNTAFQSLFPLLLR